ncbi:monofunctional biosynthetic peptidoglycan transglycosylase [Sediminibacterium roseum]|uniref:Biosynthetic peptidoglycan transglycosylase n=1 Tax=Sediminibacterium roseum TaxID=1978412 RepID=A0ABW9ZTN2_9BACT|nr:monofunctional biosynthetic peptidoglycan transglycosylase [Sediminibacterium roseum]NCI50492.1 monofunctional biosynthetic peptidoglycan transglycosylase [Sediminibacterium roseum]
MKKTRLRRWIRILYKVFLFMFFSNLVYVVFCKWLYPPITLTQAYYIAESHLHGTSTIKRDYVPYDSISANIKLAVIASEDLRFGAHNGIDWKAIKKAREFNSKHRDSVVFGASTITQQTAKNVFLWKGRSYFRKVLEGYFALMINAVWGKRRTLDIYLNVIEFGKGVYGIEAASNHFFKKKSAYLTEEESARLAACLPSPQTLNPLNQSKNFMDRVAQIKDLMAFKSSDPDLEAIIYQ